MTEIRCPHCQFRKEADIAALPPNVNKVTCPRCRESFPLQREEPAGTTEIINIPSLQDTQGLDPIAEPHDDPQRPKAGFWIRVVAFLVDEFIVAILVSVFGGILFLVGTINGLVGTDSNDSFHLFVQIFGYLLNFVYYIFFTGYCGQTPGKMAFRIKVIRTDGSPLSYPRATFREIPAKFISWIILGIGYLMVAFDEKKQGLHDRMADTYVIKL